MISRNSLNKISTEEFREMASYFGIAIQTQLPISLLNPNHSFVDIEIFFLSSTYCLTTSRITEGYLCWLLEFGHLLSPSKIRRLIRAGYLYDSAILGGLIEFLLENKIMPNQWKIVTPFCHKRKKSEQLFEGPTPRTPSSYFLKYRILAPQFQLDGTKFLTPTKAIYRSCVELRNRARFGSIVNADVASYLEKHPTSTAYQIAKGTHHHKARVFTVYENILAAS
ncbi:MAG: hypothetical protein IPM97_16170 [Bdellovibrionaceae bacterium]|nr:hypothetical protein [Pseudobdellovibrionaceae bacterium]